MFFNLRKYSCRKCARVCVYRREVLGVTGLGLIYIMLCTDYVGSPGKLLPTCVSVQRKFGK
jgi:hypothetical protein